VVDVEAFVLPELLPPDALVGVPEGDVVDEAFEAFDELPPALDAALSPAPPVVTGEAAGELHAAANNRNESARSRRFRKRGRGGPAPPSEPCTLGLYHLRTSLTRRNFSHFTSPWLARSETPRSQPRGSKK
jgi:hypothetical protein